MNTIKENAINNPNSHNAGFLNSCFKKGIDFATVIHKKIIDDYEKIEINSRKYQLLPMGVINDNLSDEFINPEYIAASGYFSINQFRRNILDEPDFRLFYYPNDIKKPEISTFRRICESYKKHYQENLEEIWNDENFYQMIADLNYLSVKYAIDLETKEIFAIGFFGAYIRNVSGGQSLTNAELYVMPEFRHRGIAKKWLV